MLRRQILSFASAPFLLPVLAHAKENAKLHRIGYLGYSEPTLERSLVNALKEGLRDVGFRDGDDFEIEERSAEGRMERLPELAAELVALKVDIIVTLATPGALAAKQRTNTIPIVVAAMADPARDGLVATLARPGGNITGSTFLGPELIPKRLALLKEVVPSVSRVAVLWHPGVYSDRTMKDMVDETEAAARRLAVQLQLLGARNADDFGGVFAAAVKEHAEGVLVFPSPMLYLEYQRIVDQVTHIQLPAVYPWREAVDAGGLMSYGASIPDLLRSAARLVGKIFKGARPAELPIEQPTKFELTINLNAARNIGLTIPQSILARANDVVE